METLYITFLNKKPWNIIITTTSRAAKGNRKLFKDSCKDFQNEQEMSNKAGFLLGDFKLNAIDCNTNEVVKYFLNMVFENGLLPLIQRPTRVTRRVTNKVLENKIQFIIIKIYIGDQFPRFIVLTTNEICSIEERKFIKCVFQWKRWYFSIPTIKNKIGKSFTQ